MKSESMRRVAVHEVIRDDGETQTMCVVEISKGSVVCCRHLNGEEPMVEWLGGTLVIRNGDDGILRAYMNNKLIE